MRFWRDFWNDETGAIISAELVTIGTLLGVGMVVGAKTVSNAVNDEMKDVARAVRSLDQSYSYRGFRGCCSATAGSAYRQPPIDLALSPLDADDRTNPLARDAETVPDEATEESDDEPRISAPGVPTPADEKLGPST